MVTQIDDRLMCGHVESDSCDCYCPRCDHELSPDPHMRSLCARCVTEEEE